MNLSNHGWGLNQMLIYCAILLFFLFIAIFFIVQLSNSLGNTLKDSLVDEITYFMVEHNVEEATFSYIEKYYEEEIETGTVTVTTENLLKHNILSDSSLKPTEEKSSCVGYALVKKENDEFFVSPYIKCSKYQTSGYQSWRAGK